MLILKTDILFLGECSPQVLGDEAISTEAKYSNNFKGSRKKEVCVIMQAKVFIKMYLL